MSEHAAIVLSDDLLVGERMKKTASVHIVRVAPLELEREVNFTPARIVPLFPGFRDEEGEYGARREINTYEAILPFGDNRVPPRREPLEIPWTRTRV